MVPGIHSVTFTHEFIRSVQPLLDKAWVTPSQVVPVYSPQHVLAFLDMQCEHIGLDGSTLGHGSQAILFIGFSAGVVGSIGAARQWQTQGGQVTALIAVDGWGVPLYGDFPIHRVSHDVWTHWSSLHWGPAYDNFYAEPAVAHLELWRSPHTASGIRTGTQQHNVSFSDDQKGKTAGAFVQSLLNFYGKK